MIMARLNMGILQETNNNSGGDSLREFLSQKIKTNFKRITEIHHSK
jgi:hypothetical protein